LKQTERCLLLRHLQRNTAPLHNLIRELMLGIIEIGGAKAFSMDTGPLVKE
jgi:hypothetical protein